MFRKLIYTYIKQLQHCQKQKNRGQNKKRGSSNQLKLVNVQGDTNLRAYIVKINKKYLNVDPINVAALGMHHICLK